MAVFKHVKPPGVVGTHDSHVVGNDVENLPQTVRLEGRHEFLVALFSANFRIEDAVIDDVVAVGAPGTRPEVRRSIAVADPELGQIGDQLGRLGEGEIAVELKAIRGAWYHCGAARQCRVAMPQEGVAALASQRFVERREALIATPVFQIERQATAPVWMLVILAAREIGLLDLAKNIFRLHHEHLRRRARQVGMNCNHDCRCHDGHRYRMDTGLSGQEFFAFQGHQ